MGFKELDNGEPADVYVINTCTVTQRADSQSLNLIRKAKRENPNSKIIVTGCLTELDNERIKSEGIVDLSVRNIDKGRTAELFLERKGLVKDLKGVSDFKGHTRAFLKVQDGCDNTCSYCKVPLVRGRSKSREPQDIIKEAARLVKNGFKEIVLTGICLGAFGKDLEKESSLLSLIEDLEEISGLLRIRLSSIEAGDITYGLIAKMAASKKLCRHLHVPIQSGDNDILRRMRRNYSREHYSDLIMKIRNKVPDAAITTDCLVGFPGETDENFKNTVDLVSNILPLKVHIFPYSKREGTRAAQFNESLSSGVIRERIKYLKETADRCSLDYKKKFLNKVIDILFESESKTYPDFIEGHSANYLKVMLKSGIELKNKLIPVKLKELKPEYFLCEPA